jgi:hypothetical protein
LEFLVRELRRICAGNCFILARISMPFVALWFSLDQHAVGFTSNLVTLVRNHVGDGQLATVMLVY